LSKDEDEMRCRKLLLDFYSSQTNTHGSLIIGFSVVLFAIVEIRISPMVAVYLSAFQNRILYFGMFLAGLVFYYLLFRYISYGTLANYTILTPWREPSEEKTEMCNAEFFSKQVSKYVRQNAGLKWLIRYFITSTREGFLTASLLSLLTTFSFSLVLDYSDFMLVDTLSLFLVTLGFCLFLFSRKNRE
jgi:hypothetical protein